MGFVVNKRGIMNHTNAHAPILNGDFMRIYYSEPTIPTHESKVTRQVVLDLMQNRFPTVEILEPAIKRLDVESDYLEIVRRVQGEILDSDLVIADFSARSTNVAMEAFWANAEGIRVIGFIGGDPCPWVRYIADYLVSDTFELEDRLHQLIT